MPSFNQNQVLLEPSVWGPHFWFFLHTIAMNYPPRANEVTKRKYYDLIQNMPLFIPNQEIGNRFSAYLDKYPVSPYLYSRDSFIRWVHFLHNQFNHFLKKEEMSLFTALDNYFANYKPKQLLLSEQYHIKKEYVIACFTILCIIFIFFCYR